jgi:sporulation protein YlmC with PRC-barrel domain
MLQATIYLVIINLGVAMDGQRDWEVKDLTKDIIGHWILGKDGKRIGRIHDVTISSETKFPHIDGLVVICVGNGIFKKRQIPKKTFIPWTDIGSIEGVFFILEKTRENICAKEVPDNKILLVKRVLDEQLVDVKNMFIGRVEDIELIYTRHDNSLVVAGIYTGMAAMITRLGFQRSGKLMANLFGRELSEDVISWHSVKKLCNRPRKIVLKIRATKTENLYAKALDEVANNFVISIDDLEEIIYSPKNEILVDRFGSEEIILPVTEKFRSFVSKLQNKCLRKEYIRMLASIEKHQQVYDRLVEKNKKFRKRYEDLFEALVDMIKVKKDFSISRLIKRIAHANHILKEHASKSGRV